MPADRNTIIEWLQESALGGARWVVIASDPAQEGDDWYPIPTMSRDLVLRFAEDKDTREIYDLNLPFEEQLEEARAWHPPVDS